MLHPKMGGKHVRPGTSDSYDRPSGVNCFLAGFFIGFPRRPRADPQPTARLCGFAVKLKTPARRFKKDCEIFHELGQSYFLHQFR
jgi:hypothetical protein